MSQPSSVAAATPVQIPYFALVGVLVVMFLSAVDATIVSTAMPRVVEAIGGMGLYPWAFSAFMLTSTVVTPFYGKFADLYGVRRCMFVAIALFLFGSGICGLATSMIQLVLFRAFQGLGAGGVAILTFIAFGHLVPPELRGRMQGLVSIVWGVSSLVGPLAGGLMIAHFPWPWIFWINLPIGLIATAMIYFGFPRHQEAHREHTIDWPGAALLLVGLTALMLALTEKGTLALVCWPVGVVGLAGFLWRQSVAPEPVMPLAPFGNRLFSVSAAVSFLSCLTMFAALTYVPLFVQGVLSRSAPEAGAVLTPMMVGWPLAGALAGAGLNRLGFRKLVVFGAVSMALGFAFLAYPGFKDNTWLLSAQAALLGIGMGFITSTSMVAAQVSVPKRQIGTASSTLGLVRNVGSAIGVNLLGGLQLHELARELDRATLGLSNAQSALLHNPQALLSGRGMLPPAVWQVFQQALSNSLLLIFGVSLGIAVVGVLVAWWMPPLTPKQAAESVEPGGAA